MYDVRPEDGDMDRPAPRDTRLTSDDFLLFPALLLSCLHSQFNWPDCSPEG